MNQVCKNTSVKSEPAEQLIRENLDQIQLTALTLARGNSNIEAEEFFADGFFGLHQAAIHYRPQSNIPFRAYSRHGIRGAMISGLFKKQSRIVPESSDTWKPFTTIDDRESLRKLLQPLPRALRLVMLLRYEAGLEFSEIGRAVGVCSSRAAGLHAEAICTLKGIFCHDRQERRRNKQNARG